MEAIIVIVIIVAIYGIVLTLMAIGASYRIDEIINTGYFTQRGRAYKVIELNKGDENLTCRTTSGTTSAAKMSQSSLR